MKLLFKQALVVLALCFSLVTYAQQEIPKDWMHKNPDDAVYGVNDEAAYRFLKGKTSTPVIVAVIDAGVEVDHPDLQKNIWVNTGETPGNQQDDDRNGYADDVNGWDFIGGKDGNDVWHDNYELTRLYRYYTKKFNSTTDATVAAADKDAYAQFKKIKTKYEQEKEDADKNYNQFNQLYDMVNKVLVDMHKDDVTAADLNAYKPEDQSLVMGKTILQKVMEQGYTAKQTLDELKEAKDHYESESKYGMNTDYDPRYIVGDNYDDANERNYGNNDVKGPDAMHGTHVAGIIGAVRGNNEGIDGIADNVKIMVVRTVPDGDERDKDVANAIRYAVDNGAKVINMSFGKAYAYNKKTVDDAVKYAMSKDVLLVHGAGNDHLNVDKEVVYPNDQLLDGTKVTNWLNVGATDIAGNTADFSNYGKKNVDVFAPGVRIYSSVTNHDYKYLDGTSMASPVAAGVAALIREYYPKLTAAQVKKIMIKSVYKPKHKVALPGSEKKMVKLKKISVSGGIVNAYKAVQLADRMSK